MIKLIDKLEKSKAFWFLIIISLFFFFLRLPSLIEPYWYGDEGIYQVVGMALNNGQMLYSGIWDNKPPLLYLTYAFFNGDQYNVRLASLLIGLFATWGFFFLSQKLFKKLRTSIITTVAFTLLFATPIIEGNIANAENFMLLPIILAALFIYNENLKQPKLSFLNFHFSIYSLAGILLGIAFLFKIVALFDFAAFLIFLIITSLPEKLSWSESKKFFRHGSWGFTVIRNSLFITLGFLLPFAITIGYFLTNNAFGDFIYATFSGMFGYVGYGNQLIIPQGFLILKLLILGSILGVLIYNRNKLSKPALFILLWTAFSLFNAFFSQRPYIHYMLVLIPSVCLLFGLVVTTTSRKTQLQLLAILLIVLATIFTTFKTYSVKKTFMYYQNAFLFVTGLKDVTSYQAFFDGKTPRDYQLASFIKMHTKPSDRIFIWGDSAQIYSLSQTLPINKYTVSYHMRQNKQSMTDTQYSLITQSPKYVIILSESSNFPFKLDNYNNAFSLNRAIIYERAN